MYFHYRYEDSTPWSYPTGMVLIVVLATVIETALAYYAFGLADRGRLWMRALFGLGFLMPWGLLISPLFLHMPYFWVLHTLWVWLVIACLVVGALTSGVTHAFEAIRARETQL